MNIKLNKLADNRLTEKEMEKTTGGNYCTCGCCYANNGGSSTSGNAGANYGSNLTTKCAEVKETWMDVYFW